MRTTLLSPVVHALDAPTRNAVENLMQRYRHGSLSRREFFQKLAFATGSLLVAQRLLRQEGFASPAEVTDWSDPQAQQPPSPKESIAAGEKRLPASLTAEWVRYPSGEIQVGGYLARPRTGAPFAALLVIHENRGLTEFVLDIVQRWAAEGLLAIAPDCLSRSGGTPAFDSMDAAREAIGRLQRPDVLADLHATLRYVQARPDVRKNRIGVSGFCWGGGQSFHFATESNHLAFAVPFYGPAPPLDQLGRISCPVFAVYAEDDPRVNANLDEVEARMKALGKSYARRTFPGTQHAFMNFTAPARYNPEQARAAWAEVTAFVKKIVG